ncbi:MAG: nitroreductase family protein [Candidatus Helarchaeota archaeon]|nr:nitroreductase family protein [Candidatus Helarchaeota archaeon]
MNIWECIYTRRSERRFKGDKGRKIPAKEVEEILDAARYAFQIEGIPQWRFLLIFDQDTKNLLAEFAQEVAHMIFGISYEIFGGHIWYLPEDRRPTIAEYTQTGELWKYPIEADFVVIPCITKGAWFDSRVPYMEQSTAVGGMAIQNMWLTANKLGWGAGCNAMPLNDLRRRELFSTFTGVPMSWQMCAAYCFGDKVSARSVGPSRASLEGIAFNEHWGNRFVRSGFRTESSEIVIPTKDVTETIKGVHNCYKFAAGAEVEDWKLEKMLHCGIWSPNPENLNHWRHIVIRDEKTKQYVADCTKEAYVLEHKSSFEKTKNHLPHLSEDQVIEYVEWMMEEGWKYPLECDAIILTTFAKDWVEYAHIGGTLPGGIDYIWSTATGCGIQNMRLAAQALGLETQINLYSIAEFRRNEGLVSQLGIPGSWVPLTMLCVGEAGDAPDFITKKRPKPPVKDVVFDEFWGIRHTPLA